MENISTAELENEQAVLSCVLIDQSTWAEMAIRPSDFQHLRHVMIATAIEKLFKNGIDVDLMTLNVELDKSNLLAEIGGPAYLTKISIAAPTSLNARSYANELRNRSARRKLHNAAEKIVNLAHDLEKPLTTVISEARQFLDDALNNSKIQVGRSLADAIREFDETIEARRGKDFNLLGIPTGYSDIDDTLDGLQDGWFYLIAARPGNGKTAMLGNLASNISKQNKQVLFFSAEMHESRIVARMVAAETKINSNILKHAGMTTEAEWESYYKAIQTFEPLPMRLYRPDECRAVEQIESITRQLHARGEVDIIFVDYLQLLQLESATRSTIREQEVTKIAQALKRITNLNIPVVAAAQLSRAVEQRTDSKPQLSDLRESGSLEQEADAVCFLHHPNDELENSLEFIVSKNRDGALGTCPLVYDKTTQKIKSGIKQKFILNQ